jgi:hypothetical protein
MRLRHSFAIAAAAVALSTSYARAEERWYGYQVLATDLGGWALVTGGVMAELPPMWLTGVGALLLGGPLVHAAHGNHGSAAASLGLRVGGPLLGAAGGAALSSAFGGSGGESGAGRTINLFLFSAVGAMVGYVAAATIDIAYVAREDDATATPRMFSVGGRF